MAKKVNGLVGLVFLLGALGGGVYLSEDDFDNAYYCSTTNEFGVFDRLSSTGRTAYWTDEEGRNRRKLCGVTWIKLSVYAANEGLTKDDILGTASPVVPVVENGCHTGQLCYECDSVGCREFIGG